ncbi:HAD family hydrolase [Bacillus sp. 1P06AnD]|uniref:HAD family hydrolase n=1 Tax=Bacillus sp. 1P06AnD TaxID=3132208 RepID=UPI0039A01306
MIYKLLAVNIDGTLLQSNGRFSKATKEALEYVHGKGVLVSLVTSRNYQFCKKVAKSLKINPMVIAAQGAYIGTSIDKPLFMKKISEKTTKDIVSLLEDLKCQFKLNYEQKQVGNRVNLPENFIGKAALYVSEQKMFSQHFVDSVTDYLNENTDYPLGIEAVFQSQKEVQETRVIIQNMFDDIYSVQKDKNQLLIVPEGVSKWRGLQYLADHFKVKRQELVAIGDGEDDREMIKGAGVGVAMGSGHSVLQHEADWVTRGNDDEGVAYMVKELFRKQYQLQFLEKMNLLK